MESATSWGCMNDAVQRLLWRLSCGWMKMTLFGTNEVNAMTACSWNEWLYEWCNNS
jgi:hypothetical protein